MSDTPEPANLNTLNAKPASWLDGYKRRLLDFVKAPADVDLDTVEITQSLSDDYDYLHHTTLNENVVIDVVWLHPDVPKYRREPDAQNLHRHTESISQEEVVEFLTTLLTP